MINDIYAEIDLIIGINIVLQIFLEMVIPDIRVDADIIVPGIDRDRIVILTVDEGSVGEEPAIENMVPPESGRRIAVIYSKSVPLTKNFLPHEPLPPICSFPPH